MNILIRREDSFVVVVVLGYLGGQILTEPI
jgi:hypothetical protein